jgi:transcriptional regulator with XRE-family HTH domain
MHFMTHLDHMNRIELAAQKKGVSLTEFFKKAGIAPSTWTRWRRKDTEPTLKKWRKVEEAARDLGLNKRAA